MKEDYPRVLVAAPTYSGMEYCQDKFLNALKEIDHPNFEILIIDNGEDREYFKRLESVEGIRAMKLSLKGEKPMKKIIRTRNKILQIGALENFDYILMMDSDVIPPPQILKKLISHNKDIVSGVYYNIFTINGKDCVRPVAWVGVSDEEYEKVKKHLSEKEIKVIERNGGLRRFLTLEEASSGGLVKVIIPSAGCMLLSKKAFSVLKYGLLEMSDGLRTSDDVFFSIMANKKGFEAFVDTSLVCQHLTEGKMVRKEDALYHPAYE